MKEEVLQRIEQIDDYNILKFIYDLLDGMKEQANSQQKKD